jgi:hypothetical protein
MAVANNVAAPPVIASGVPAKLPFPDADAILLASFTHVLPGVPDDFVCAVPGEYQIATIILYTAAATTTSITTEIQINGQTIAKETKAPAGPGIVGHMVTITKFLEAGDIINILIGQVDSGAAAMATVLCLLGVGQN